MPDLLELLNTITRHREPEEESAFDSLTSVRKWLNALPAESDYETFQALVEGLERFNAENVEANAERLKVLMAIEEAGLPLQSRVAEHYMRVINQPSLRLGRQTLWRKSSAFWSLLAAAWTNMLKHAYKGPADLELKPWRVAIATRAMRYTGHAMRWGYHRSELPSEAAWQRVQKIYRLVERGGHAQTAVTLNARETSCAREFSLVVLLGLTNPVGFKTEEVESIAQMLDSFADLPLPQTSFESDRHTHAIDLSVFEGAFALDGNQPAGERLRYFDLAPLVEHLLSFAPQSNDEDEDCLPRRVAKLISRGILRRSRQRTRRFGRVWVASGVANIMAALLGTQYGKPHKGLERWTLRDESTEGIGFGLEESTVMPHGRLVAVSSNPSEDTWQLLAIRWNQKVGGQLLVGAQRLSRHPKRVEISFAPEADAAKAATHAVLLPTGDSGQGEINLLMPQTHYRAGARMVLRDGDVIYGVRLGQVHESHERWVRVGVDVLSREQFAVAA